VCAASLYGQYGHQRFSWQEACFKNPGAPYCPGHDFAVKPTPPGKGVKPSGPAPDFEPLPSTPETVTPSVIVVGGIDWRFVDPSADAMAAFNVSRISSSPMARSLMVLLGANQGITAAEVEKILEGLTGVEQVALSIREKRVVAWVTGRLTESTLPATEAGWKAVRLVGNAMLIGHVDAVDQAVQRLAMQDAWPEWTSLAEERQANCEFWAVGSAALVGPQAVSAGVKRFSLTVSIRDRLTSDVAFEFNGTPSAETLQKWQSTMPGATIEGGMVHVRMSMEAEEVQQKFAPVIVSPLGQRLASLVKAARYLQMRDTTLLKQTRPVIYGLDGGPRELNQNPNR